MRLKVKFGFIDTKETTWWRPLEDFPHMIRYLGRNYEWVMYDKDLTGNSDMILVYSEIPTYDPNYGVVCSSWGELFGDSSWGCECGAAFSSFSWDHLRYCPKWSKW